MTRCFGCCLGRGPDLNICDTRIRGSCSFCYSNSRAPRRMAHTGVTARFNALLLTATSMSICFMLMQKCISLPMICLPVSNKQKQRSITCQYKIVGLQCAAVVCLPRWGADLNRRGCIEGEIHAFHVHFLEGLPGRLYKYSSGSLSSSLMICYNYAE